MNWKKTLLFISTAIGTTTLAFHVINKFIFNASDEHSEEDESNYYNWKFGNIYYKKEGTGSPVLLIHDLNHYSSSMESDKVIGTLSKEHTVYTIDLLGCGNYRRKDRYRSYRGFSLLCNSCLSEYSRPDWPYYSGLSGKHTCTCKSSKSQIKTTCKDNKYPYIRNIYL